MNIYLMNETDFKHNGLGFLTDLISAKVTDNLNGDYSLFFEYKINGHLSEYIKNENIVKCQVEDGSKQLFIIKNIQKTFNSIQVSCKHIFYLLIDNFLEDVAPTRLACESFFKWFLDRTNYSHNFVAHSNISDIKSARYIRRNPVEAILGDSNNSMVNLFGGELKRDNFDIYFNYRIGADNHVKLIIGKNIKGITITTNTDSIHTRIMPQGFDGLFLPEKYVDSPLIGIYPNPKIYKAEFSDIKYDPEDDDAYNTLDEAYNALRSATYDLFNNGIDKPTINVKIDWIELSKTNEYKNYSNLERVRLGDTITVDLLGLTYTTRVIKTIYNPLTEVIESFELGVPKANICTSTNNIQRQLEQINPTSLLETAKANATDMLTKAMGGYVYKTTNELFIMDTNDPKTATKVWRWNMNGLGYSSNGVDGPYETAMTSDGKIVADFITTGTMSVERIEGLKQILLQVQNTINLTKTVYSDNGKLSLENTSEDYLNYLKIRVDISLLFGVSVANYGYDLFLGDDLALNDSLTLSEGVPYELRNGPLYGSDTLFGRNSNLIIRNGNDTQKIKLPIDYLNYIDEETYDEFIVEKKEMFIIRRVGINENGEKYKLSFETKQYLGTLEVILKEGTNEIYLESFNNATLECTYMIKNDYTNTFATKVELQAGINTTAESVLIEAQKKIDDLDVVSKLNVSPEVIEILGNRLVIDTSNFKLDENGNMTCSNANANNLNIKGGTIQLEDTSDASNSRLSFRNGNISSIFGSNFINIENKNTNTFFKLDTNVNNNFGHLIFSNNEIVSENNSELKHGIFVDLDNNHPMLQFFIDKSTVFELRRGRLNLDTAVYANSYNNLSLASKKKNFEYFNKGLELINNSDFYLYNFKTENDDDRKHIGLVIGKGYKTPLEFINSDEIGIELYSLVSACGDAIKTLNKKIEKLEKENEVLKNGK